ncbi:hypothetical protein HHL22_04790 [Hymenobacter sp. RP-2-7]|uniref:DUF3352 domain-containing protein n=1 Tax=Hymenobacter polaris TaxID=2682546 RepID=A0A7Y0FLI2_9BACT|nr:hypothetical protein [Hymenobacter polaris]NML64515.1 hypothetical protein [Hymenobacter polaris]
MSRKLLALLLASLLLLSLATYVYYRRTLAAVPVDAYALVPDDAVLVLATRNHPALVRHLQEAGVWDNLTGVRYYQQVAGQLTLADSLATGGNPSASPRRGLLSLLGNKLVLTSLHVTGPRQVDLLYQLPLLSVREYRQARGLLETLGRDPRYTLGARAYEGQELQELTRRGGERLTLLNYRNHLLFSTNPGLVEAVVHRLAHPDAPTVRAGFGETDLFRLRDFDATLLINFRRLPGLLDVLCQPGTHARLDQALALVRDGWLGLQLAPGQLTCTGFANPETAAGAWQAQMSGPPTQALRPLAEVLPQRTALLLAVDGRLPLAAAPDSATRPALDSLRASLLPGAALAWLAAPTPGPPPAPVLVLRCRAPGRAASWLARLRRAARVAPAFERVGRFELFGAPVGAAQLAGPLGGPAPADTVPLGTVLMGSYLVWGEKASLRRYAAEVAAGRVWSRSTTQVALVQQALPQARLTLLADVRQGWNALLGTLAEDRRAGLLRNESLLRRFPQVAWQLLPPDAAPRAGGPAQAGPYYAQLLLRRATEATAADSALAASTGTRFRTALAGKPLLLSAAENAYSTVLADSAGVLRLLPGAPGALPWVDSLPGPAVGPGPRLVRGRLLLATAHQVHWLSVADGREAPGFPLNLPDTTTLTAVVAAPGTPRLVVATATDLLLLDTNGRRYPGWPRRLEAPLAGPPALLTVGGRDVVVAALRNGYVYAFDQAGERYPGFPVSAGARLAGPLLATAGPTLAKSQLRLVNQHGELLAFTLSGDVTSRRRLATWSRTASFRLVPEASRRAGSFVVVRQDGGQLSAFSPTGELLLSRQLLTSGEKPVQWFDFGGSHQVLALTEPLPGQVTLYTGQGRPLAGSASAPATWPSTGTGVALRYDGARRRYLLVRYQGRELHRDEVAE